MFCLGEINSLQVFKKIAFGLILRDPGSEETVLLPNKYVSKELDLEDWIDVFLYTDSEDRIVATSLRPKILLNQIDVLEVRDVTGFGSFLDWGLEKDLFLPFAAQEGKVQKGDKIAVCLCLDEQTGRLFASAKNRDFYRRKNMVQEGDRVDLVIGSASDLGYQVIINQWNVGLLFFDKVFQPLRQGDKIQGFVEKIREDGKIDISLQKKGYVQVIDSQEVLLKKLQENSGVLHLTDASDPDAITRELCMSKRNFKKCVGALYKQRKIKIEKDCILLCP